MAGSGPDDSHLVLILTTTDVDFLPVVRSLLDSADIPHLVQGDHALAQLPTGPMAGPFARSGIAARVFVAAGYEAEARALLASGDAAGVGGEEE